jgi:hypothetical protein
MAETKYDPSKLFIGTRLFKDSNEAGNPIVDEKGEWTTGEVEITLLDRKTGFTVATKKVKTTKNKYLVFREDFDGLSTEDVIKEHFSDIQLEEATDTELQKEAAHSKAASDLATALAEIETLKAEAAARETPAVEYEELPATEEVVEEKPAKTKKK